MCVKSLQQFLNEDLPPSDVWPKQRVYVKHPGFFIHASGHATVLFTDEDVPMTLDKAMRDKGNVTHYVKVVLDDACTKFLEGLRFFDDMSKKSPLRCLLADIFTARRTFSIDVQPESDAQDVWSFYCAAMLMNSTATSHLLNTIAAHGAFARQQIDEMTG